MYASDVIYERVRTTWFIVDYRLDNSSISSRIGRHKKVTHIIYTMCMCVVCEYMLFRPQRKSQFQHFECSTLKTISALKIGVHVNHSANLYIWIYIYAKLARFKNMHLCSQQNNHFHYMVWLNTLMDKCVVMVEVWRWGGWIELKTQWLWGQIKVMKH